VLLLLLLIVADVHSMPAGNRWEAAVYGALCGHVTAMLPVCASWEDEMWSYCRWEGAGDVQALGWGLGYWPSTTSVLLTSGAGGRVLFCAVHRDVLGVSRVQSMFAELAALGMQQ
jgi:hypothetical protein